MTDGDAADGLAPEQSASSFDNEPTPWRGPQAHSILNGLASWSPVLALLALALVAAVASPTFFSGPNLRNIFVTASILVIVTLGQTFVISTSGIDLSVVAVAQLGGMALAIGLSREWSLPASIALALLVGVLAGCINGILVGKVGVYDFIVTLATASALGGATLLSSDARPKPVQSEFLLQLMTRSVGPFPVIALVTAAIVGACYALMFRTTFGSHLLAIGGNREAATSLGVRFSRVKIGVYAISGLFAALAGVLLAARLGAAEPTVGAQYQLTSIAAAVLGGVSLFGGRSSIIGPSLGALILTGVVNLLTITAVAVHWQPVAVGAVVLLAAVLRRYERV